jgi:hypothetical protein
MSGTGSQRWKFSAPVTVTADACTGLTMDDGDGPEDSSGPATQIDATTIELQYGDDFPPGNTWAVTQPVTGIVQAASVTNGQTGTNV